MDLINNRFGIQKSQICMVGDRLDTDILFGQNGGCKTLLVLSGKWQLSYHSSSSLNNLIENISPLFNRCDFIVNASKSEQQHTTRFLHQQDFGFSFSQSGSCMIICLLSIVICFKSTFHYLTLQS